MKYRGLANIEFKKDPRDGRFKLIEVNPRSALSGETAVASGVDIPYIAYRDMIGEKVQRDAFFSEGVKWVDLVEDFKASLLNGCERKLTLAEWIRSLRGRRSYAIWSADDPLPFIIQFTRLSRLVLSKMFHSFKTRRQA
jgi:predicted ATP-grasp superfamily ATP-dependent carboligase